jgi:hypothetical protein
MNHCAVIKSNPTFGFSQLVPTFATELESKIAPRLSRQRQFSRRQMAVTSRPVAGQNAGDSAQALASGDLAAL